MPSIFACAKQVARGVQRELFPSSERAMLQRLEREATRCPRYTPGEVSAGSYRVAYADAMSVWPQWEDMFVSETMAFSAETAMPRILDCGANVGIASMYFKRQYPQASITAFEADPGLAEICRRNVARLPGPPVGVEAAAVWTHDGELEFVCEGSDSGAVASLEPSVDGRRTIIPARRLRHWLNEPIDLLKLDIEGAELPVLRDCADLLRNVRILMIDLHEFDPAQRQTGAVFDLLTAAGFVYDMQHLTSLPWRPPKLPSPFPKSAPVWAVMVRAWRR
jgi:FkbM family methyltransferase